MGQGGMATRQLVLQQLGRPNGSKDSMPRRRRIVCEILPTSDKEGCMHAHASPGSSGMDSYLNDPIYESSSMPSSSFAQSRSGIRFCGSAKISPESIDDQLHRWEASIWCVSDPFMQDWKQQAFAFQRSEIN